MKFNQDFYPFEEFKSYENEDIEFNLDDYESDYWEDIIPDADEIADSLEKQIEEDLKYSDEELYPPDEELFEPDFPQYYDDEPSDSDNEILDLDVPDDDPIPF